MYAKLIADGKLMVDDDGLVFVDLIGGKRWRHL
jgi:hypothetical protein